MFSFLKKKKSNLEQEQILEKEIIEYNENITDTIFSTIIKYVPADDEEAPPKLIKICDFHASMLPNINSIIWAPNTDKTALFPYKVIRFDFIEDIDSAINSIPYIVVKDAKYNDIL